MLFRSDRKSTRLNSSHLVISYAVFCLKKKKNQRHDITRAAPHMGDLFAIDFTVPAALSQPRVRSSTLSLCTAPAAPSLFFFFLMIRRPPRSTLFPYPTLSR